MRRHLSITRLILVTAITLVATAPNALAQQRPVTLTVVLRGVYQSKISLVPLAGQSAYKPILTTDIKGGQQATLTVPAEYLPGEFALRFDYLQKADSVPYPSEKNIVINNQNLFLWTSPPYCNNADSTWFQPGETENTAFSAFSKENERLKAPVLLLQSVLLSYDDTSGDFYSQTFKEYKKRMQSYNRWLVNARAKDKGLFVSNLYHFNYVPEINWQATNKAARVKDLISHYFDGMDFANPLIIKTAQLVKWMDGYVNLYGELITRNSLRDSLLSIAAHTAIKKARSGNPLVYGWMVDYFYKGFETNNIPAGMLALQTYIDDPNCLTQNRLQIGKRLKGIESLIPGATAPNIIMANANKQAFDLYTYRTSTKYILVLFWAAGCSHCNEFIKQLDPWYQQKLVMQKLKIIGVSLDDNANDIKEWQKRVPGLRSWEHLQAEEGVRSKVANDYFILSTPSMFLLDSETKQIVAVPGTFEQLAAALK